MNCLCVCVCVSESVLSVEGNRTVFFFSLIVVCVGLLCGT